jgi:hypothetical protein
MWVAYPSHVTSDKLRNIFNMEKIISEKTALKTEEAHS